MSILFDCQNKKIAHILKMSSIVAISSIENRVYFLGWWPPVVEGTVKTTPPPAQATLVKRNHHSNEKGEKRFKNVEQTRELNTNSNQRPFLSKQPSFFTSMKKKYTDHLLWVGVGVEKIVKTPFTLPVEETFATGV